MLDSVIRVARSLLYNVLPFIIILSACNTPKTKVDRIIEADRIYTSNTEYQIVQCMAISDSKIVAVGTAEEIRSMYEAAEDTTIQGFIYPGFIDAHSHFLGYGMHLVRADLTKTFSMQEVMDRLVAHAQRTKEEWILGRGWDETDWSEMSNVNNTALNAYFPNRPVWVKRVDGHAGLANDVALQLAGITPDTRVEGGEIGVVGGRLTGVLSDNAMSMIEQLIPEAPTATKIEALLHAQRNCFSVGLTAVCDAGIDLQDLLLIDSLQQTGDLSIRLYAMCNPTEENFDYFAKNGIIHTPLLQVSSFKLYADGALGSRGAKLKRPYCDHDNYTGVWVTSPDAIDTFCQRIDAMGFQVNTHCIGDSANRRTLETYRKYTQGLDKRWRIEHAQVVSPEDIRLFEAYNVIPSVQPTHATSDMNWAQKRLCAERLDGAYAYKRLLETNQYLPLGTDFPVEQIDPLLTYHAAVHRQDNQYKPINGFLSSEALSPKETILGMTAWAARANFMDDFIGSLEPGKKADFVILDQDITREKYMLKTRVIGTYADGIRKF